MASPLPPPPLPRLAPDEIHLWIVSPDAEPSAAEALLPLLSAHEQHRASRMRDADDRWAFVAGRARVRQILSRYVGQPPPLLDVVTRVDDRPRLEGAPDWFDFSFSRCPGVHVCAVGCQRRIGVDVDVVRDTPPTPADIIACSTAEEARWLTQLSARECAAAFATLHVTKEALLKALGSGLSLSTTAVAVPRDASGVIRVPSDARSWFGHRFAPRAGRVGAVVAEGTWRLTQMAYPG